MFRILSATLLMMLCLPTMAQEHAPGHCPWCEKGVPHEHPVMKDNDESWKPPALPKESNNGTLLLVLAGALIGCIALALRARNKKAEE